MSPAISAPNKHIGNVNACTVPTAESFSHGVISFNVVGSRPATYRRVASAIIGVMTDVTQILSKIESGDPSAAEQLLPLV
jgi:hypothetical protein